MSPRPVEHIDCGALAVLHASAFPQPWTAVSIAQLLWSGAQGAVLDGAGFILWRIAAGEAEILTLAVDPTRRRRGSGRALVEAAIDRAAAAGAEMLFLEVAEDNAAAIGLYRSIGFSQVGRRRGYYAQSDGPPKDALVLQRTLNTADPFGL